MQSDIYENPLITRYGGKKMARIFSDDNRFKLWRKLWIVLAESERELGINITEEQINELYQFADKLNLDVAAEREKVVRHDVMAHVYAYGVQAVKAAPIIHLGATSCYVTDNAEIMIIHQALEEIKSKLITLLAHLSKFADKYKSLPTLGFTHLQPAQLTTVGKRAALWLQDLTEDVHALEHLMSGIKLRGVKGTTGTQASFMSLFDGDSRKVAKLEEVVVKKLGYGKVYGVTGQTYPRKFDYQVLSVLSLIAQSAYKFSNDLRILQSFKELEEPFETSQIGSSAMAYKRNPMRSERISSLARFVITLPANASITASTQWLERTLDDSANKRITIAQAFLALDGVLNLYLNIAENMVVYDKVIAKRIAAELPFMATETILMECVKLGGDRQELHERIRVHSMESAKNVKFNGGENDLISRLKGDPAFAAFSDKIDGILDAKNFIGRAPQQVDEFLEREVKPIITRNEKYLGAQSLVSV